MNPIEEYFEKWWNDNRLYLEDCTRSKIAKKAFMQGVRFGTEITSKLQQQNVGSKEKADEN